MSSLGAKTWNIWNFWSCLSVRLHLVCYCTALHCTAHCTRHSNLAARPISLAIHHQPHQFARPPPSPEIRSIARLSLSFGFVTGHQLRLFEMAPPSTFASAAAGNTTPLTPSRTDGGGDWYVHTPSPARSRFPLSCPARFTACRTRREPSKPRCHLLLPPPPPRHTFMAASMTAC